MILKNLFRRKGRTILTLVGIAIGGIGMISTLFMSVFETTHEIGVLRSLGWRRRRVLGMIPKESVVLGTIGGVCGIPLGLGLEGLIDMVGIWEGAIGPLYAPWLFVQAVGAAMIAGVAGGLYPAWRVANL